LHEAQPDVYLCLTSATQPVSDTTEEGLQMDPQEPDRTGTLDDLLAEVALTYPMAAYTAIHDEDGE